MARSAEGKCRGCDAAILWARNPQTGKLMPFDRQPSDAGEWHLTVTDDRQLEARHDRSAPVRHVPHFATCPKAELFRRPA